MSWPLQKAGEVFKLWAALRWCRDWQEGQPAREGRGEVDRSTRRLLKGSLVYRETRGCCPEIVEDLKPFA
jgi:hypothetical protein